MSLVFRVLSTIKGMPGCDIELQEEMGTTESIHPMDYV